MGSEMCIRDRNTLRFNRPRECPGSCGLNNHSVAHRHGERAPAPAIVMGTALKPHEVGYRSRRPLWRRPTLTFNFQYARGHGYTFQSTVTNFGLNLDCGPPVCSMVMVISARISSRFSSSVAVTYHARTSATPATSDKTPPAPASSTSSASIASSWSVNALFIRPN